MKIKSTKRVQFKGRDSSERFAAFDFDDDDPSTAEAACKKSIEKQKKKTSSRNNRPDVTIALPRPKKKPNVEFSRLSISCDHFTKARVIFKKKSEDMGLLHETSSQPRPINELAESILPALLERWPRTDHDILQSLPFPQFHVVENENPKDDASRYDDSQDRILNANQDAGGKGQKIDVPLTEVRGRVETVEARPMEQVHAGYLTSAGASKESILAMVWREYEPEEVWSEDDDVDAGPSSDWVHDLHLNVLDLSAIHGSDSAIEISSPCSKVFENIFLEEPHVVLSTYSHTETSCLMYCWRLLRDSTVWAHMEEFAGVGNEMEVMGGSEFLDHVASMFSGDLDGLKLSLQCMERHSFESTVVMPLEEQSIAGNVSCKLRLPSMENICINGARASSICIESARIIELCCSQPFREIPELTNKDLSQSLGQIYSQPSVLEKKSAVDDEDFVVSKDKLISCFKQIEFEDLPKQSSVDRLISLSRGLFNVSESTYELMLSSSYDLPLTDNPFPAPELADLSEIKALDCNEPTEPKGNVSSDLVGPSHTAIRQAPDSEHRMERCVVQNSPFEHEKANHLSTDTASKKLNEVGSASMEAAFTLVDAPSKTKRASSWVILENKPIAYNNDSIEMEHTKHSKFFHSPLAQKEINKKPSFSIVSCLKDYKREVGTANDVRPQKVRFMEKIDQDIVSSSSLVLTGKMLIPYGLQEQRSGLLNQVDMAKVVLSDNGFSPMLVHSLEYDTVFMIQVMMYNLFIQECFSSKGDVSVFMWIFDSPLDESWIAVLKKICATICEDLALRGCLVQVVTLSELRSRVVDWRDDRIQLVVICSSLDLKQLELKFQNKAGGRSMSILSCWDCSGDLNPSFNFGHIELFHGSEGAVIMSTNKEIPLTCVRRKSVVMAPCALSVSEIGLKLRHAKIMNGRKKDGSLHVVDDADVRKVVHSLEKKALDGLLAIIQRCQPEVIFTKAKFDNVSTETCTFSRFLIYVPLPGSHTNALRKCETIANMLMTLGGELMANIDFPCLSIDTVESLVHICHDAATMGSEEAITSYVCSIGMYCLKVASTLLVSCGIRSASSFLRDVIALPQYEVVGPILEEALNGLQALESSVAAGLLVDSYKWHRLCEVLTSEQDHGCKSAVEYLVVCVVESDFVREVLLEKIAAEFSAMLTNGHIQLSHPNDLDIESLNRSTCVVFYDDSGSIASAMSSIDIKTPWAYVFRVLPYEIVDKAIRGITRVTAIISLGMDGGCSSNNVDRYLIGNLRRHYGQDRLYSGPLKPEKMSSAPESSPLLTGIEQSVRSLPKKSQQRNEGEASDRYAPPTSNNTAHDVHIDPLPQPQCIPHIALNDNVAVHSKGSYRTAVVDYYGLDFKIIINDSFMQHQQVIRLLQDKYSIQTVERSLHEGVDAVLDALSAVILIDIHDAVEQEATILSIVSKKVEAAFKSCNNVFCVVLVHSADSFFSSVIATLMTKIVATSFEMTPKDCNIFFRYAACANDVASVLADACYTLEHSSNQTPAEWANRNFLLDVEGYHERILCSFECFNPISAQIVLSAFHLHDMFKLDTDTIIRKLPILSRRCVQLFYDELLKSRVVQREPSTTSNERGGRRVEMLPRASHDRHQPRDPNGAPLPYSSGPHSFNLGLMSQPSSGPIFQSGPTFANPRRKDTQYYPPGAHHRGSDPDPPPFLAFLKGRAQHMSDNRMTRHNAGMFNPMEMNEQALESNRQHFSGMSTDFFFNAKPAQTRPYCKNEKTPSSAMFTSTIEESEAFGMQASIPPVPAQPYFNFQTQGKRREREPSLFPSIQPSHYPPTPKAPRFSNSSRYSAHDIESLSSRRMGLQRHSDGQARIHWVNQ